MRRLVFGLFVCLSALLSAQGASAQAPDATSSEVLEIPVSARVDTTDAQVKQVVARWRGYLRTRSDSAEASETFWTDEARRRYDDPDLGSSLAYPSAGHFQMFSPKILSADPALEKQCEAPGDCFRVRTLWENLRTDEARFTPYALQTVFLRRSADGETWKLTNALPVRTSDWKRQQAGPIEYVYPPGRGPSREDTERAAAFVDSLASRFDVPVAEISYYLPRSSDELARILGLDYTLGPTQGIALSNEGLLFSAADGAYHSHELAHVTLPFEGPNLLVEGLATYAGGSHERSPQEMFELLHEHLRSHPDTTLEGILNREIPGVESYFVQNTLRYATGAVFVRRAYEQGGAEAVKRLFSLSEGRSATPEAFWAAISEVLGLSRDRATAALRESTEDYAKNGGQS